MFVVASAYGPLTLLVIDWFANRFYFPLTVNAQYAYFCYAMAVLAFLILDEIQEMMYIPELNYYMVKQETLSWWLPIIIMLGVYLVTRFKFWYLDEGDLTFNFN